MSTPGGLLPPGQPKPLQPGEFASATKNRDVSFLLSRIQPPSNLYIDRDDVLLFTATTSQAGGPSVTVNFRLLTVDDRIVTGSQSLVLPTTYTSASLVINLSEGFLLSVACTTPNALQRGVCFVRAQITRGKQQIANTSRMLFADYVTVNGPVAWPEGRVVDPVEGPGNLMYIKPANPLAGVDWSQQLGTNRRWRIFGVNAQLVTSAVVATRSVELRITDSATASFRAFANTTQAASLTRQYSAVLAGNYNQALANDISIVFPTIVMMNQGDVIQVVTNNLDAGDQWSNIAISVAEWLNQI